MQEHPIVKYGGGGSIMLRGVFYWQNYWVRFITLHFKQSHCVGQIIYTTPGHERTKWRKCQSQWWCSKEIHKLHKILCREFDVRTSFTSTLLPVEDRAAVNMSHLMDLCWPTDWPTIYLPVCRKSFLTFKQQVSLKNTAHVKACSHYIPAVLQHELCWAWLLASFVETPQSERSVQIPSDHVVWNQNTRTILATIQEEIFSF